MSNLDSSLRRLSDLIVKKSDAQVQAASSTLSDEAQRVADLTGSTAASALAAHTGMTTTAHGGIVASTDARLTDARTPTAHKASHATGGSDALTAANVGAEVALGNPASNGYILSSTTAGVRSWVAQVSSLAWTAITGKPTTVSGYGITDAVTTDDSRLTNARTPTAHKASHTTGVDALTAADIGAAATSHTHSAATTSVAGFMASTDKAKLDGIEIVADVTDAGNVGAAITGATAKTTPVDADMLSLIDSAASNGLKKLSWANLKATLKAYLDTIYAAITHTHAATDVTSGTLAQARGGTGVSNAGTLTNASNTTITGGGTLALGGYTATIPATGTVVLGTDSRLSDARTPTAHKASHTTGVDALTAADIGAAATSHTHSAATTSVAGFMASTDKAKLDGIEIVADVTDAGNVGAAITGATAKTTPVDADMLSLIDSAASNGLKKLSWANLKATLKAYDGAVGMGAEPVSYAQLYVYRNATASSNYEYGMFSASTITGAFADQNTYGIQFSHSFYSPTAVTNAYARQAAMRANMYNYAVASVTNVDGANYDVRNVGGGNVTAMNGIAVMASRNTGAGVINRNVGLYLQQQTVGFTNWQIYSDGGNVCFNAGTLYVGKTTGLTGSGDVDIAGKLNVDGTLTATCGIVGEAWINVAAFSNSWVAFGGTYAPPGYWKDALGIVHLRGMIKSGTVNTTAFTLPTGYKPQYAIVRSQVASNGTTEAASRVDVAADGTVIPRVPAGYNSYVSLDGISFRAYP